MKTFCHIILRALLIMFITIFLAGPIPFAAAQDYPSRPIRMIVPAEPGGSIDILARLLGQKLHERLGQPVVVENRAGAGQMIGADHVAKSAGDGYTLLMTTATYVTNSAIHTKLLFDPVTDLAGITMVGAGPLVLVVHPSLPVKSVKELIAYARSTQRQLDYGSAGVGSMPHLAAELLAATAKINIVHIPYKSLPPAVTATVGGHVQMMIGSLPNVWPQVKANRLRALAVTSAKRSAFMPELPTLAEAGIVGYDVQQWWGMFAPGKTPKEIIAKLNREIHGILDTEEFKSRLAKEGAEIVLTSPEAFSSTVKREIAMWRKVISDSHIKVE